MVEVGVGVGGGAARKASICCATHWSVSHSNVEKSIVGFRGEGSPLPSAKLGTGKGTDAQTLETKSVSKKNNLIEAVEISKLKIQS